MVSLQENELLISLTGESIGTEGREANSKTADNNNSSNNNNNDNTDNPKTPKPQPDDIKVGFGGSFKRYFLECLLNK